jgi:hypothetical protein
MSEMSVHEQKGMGFWPGPIDELDYDLDHTLQQLRRLVEQQVSRIGKIRYA